MSPGIATVVYAGLILGLFLLDRDRESRGSSALWLPIIWISIGASRMVSEWLGVAPTLRSPDDFVDGSPLDRLIFTALLGAGLMVLAARGSRTGALLRINGPILVFFLYGAVSILWSDFPVVALKRWVKAAGNLVMILVILTDPDPPRAVKQVFARSAFLLIPTSVLLIKYFPELGRAYDMFMGVATYPGVTTGKNGLGWDCVVFGLPALSRVLSMLQVNDRVRVNGPLIAQGVILAMVLWLLYMAHSAMALGCFVIGSVLIYVAQMRSIRSMPGALHLLIAAILFVCVYGIIVNADAGLIQAAGKDTTLTDRSYLWQDLLQTDINPWLGAGFESFWLGTRAELMWEKYWWRPNQAHNGYLETYLTLGWIGITLLGLVMAWGYRNIITSLQADPSLGRLKVAWFTVAVIFNLTEATFKVMHPVWIAFLLAVAALPKPENGKRASSMSTVTRAR